MGLIICEESCLIDKIRWACIVNTNRVTRGVNESVSSTMSYFSLCFTQYLKTAYSTESPSRNPTGKGKEIIETCFNQSRAAVTATGLRSGSYIGETHTRGRQGSWAVGARGERYCALYCGFNRECL